MKTYLYALATFSGTIIGVGLFGLPYTASQTGFMALLIWFAVLSIISILTHLIFGEICLRTEENHRLPGLAEIYLGKKAKFISVFSTSIGLFGGNLAYIVVGGGFLANLLAPLFGGPELVYILIYFFLGALIIFSGSRAMARSELISLIIFLGVLFFLFVEGLPYIKIENLSTTDWTNIFLPYGIILFSLSGASTIPELRELLNKKEKWLKSVIIVGLIIPIIVYLAFILVVLGSCGQNTTPDALTSLKSILGEKILLAGFIFGIITTFTSYISVGLTIKKILWYDLKFPHFSAWVLASFIPLLLYFIGFQDFIKIMAFTGAVTMGIDSVLMFLIYLKARKVGKRKPEYQIRLTKPLVYALIVMFLVGVAVELTSIL